MKYEILLPVEISNVIYKPGDIVEDLSIFRAAPAPTEENPEPIDEIQSLIGSGHIKEITE